MFITAVSYSDMIHVVIVSRRSELGEYGGIIDLEKKYLVVFALHELDQVDDSAGITEFVVVPRNQFHKVVI